MTWLKRYATEIQTLGAIVTALVALAALIGVKMQIDATAAIQQEQSARDIYREFLNLSISKPEFAEPDYCAIKGTPNEAAYRNYVDYLLYTAEQTMDASPDWETTMRDHMTAHDQYLCTQGDWAAYPSNIRRLMTGYKAKHCASPPQACGS